MNEITQNLDINVFVARRTICDRSWNYNMVIPYNRIYYILSGEGYARHNNCEYKLIPGHLYLIPAYASAHVWCPRTMEKVWTHFNTYISGSSLDLFNLHKVSYQLKSEDKAFIKSLFVRLIRIHHNPNAKLSTLENIEEKSIILLLVLPFLNTIDFRDSQPKKRNASPRLFRVVNYIESNLHRTPSLKILSEETALNPTYLTNWFTDCFGISIIKYWNRRRIEKAQKILWNSDITVKEIAYQLGFNDVSNFSKMFKNLVKTSPKQYRVNKKVLSAVY